MPGVLSFIQLLQQNKKKVVIVTNSPRKHLLTISKQLPELLSLSPWVTRDDVMETKPSPLPYLKAMHLLNISASKTVGFEDSEKGLQALLCSGVFPVLINQNPPEMSLDSSLFSHYLSFNELCQE